MKNKLIIFDIDDTLYNEIDYVKSGYLVVSKYIEDNYNLHNVYDDMIKLFNVSSKNVFNRLFDKYNISYTKDDIMILVNLYKNHDPSISLSSDAINVLQKLKENYKLAIVSDGNYNSQLLKVNALGLEKYFDKIILTDKYGKEYWKPNKLAFDVLSSELNVALSDMYYVGDNPNKDFYLSKYGIKTVRLYNKDGIYINDKYLENIKENYSINDIVDILKIVG